MFLVFFTACSKLRVAYFFSENMLISYFDNYFDLTDSQRTYLEEHIGQLLSWHRKHQTMEIANALTQLKKRYKDGLTLEDIKWIQIRHRKLWNDLMLQKLPELSVFLAGLDATHIEKMENQMN